jgi:thiol-disulfide isomerase/thioredoxin
VFVGSLIRCGQVWRPIDLPQLPDSGGVVTEAFALFSPRSSAATVPSALVANEKLKPMMDQLRVLESKLETANASERSQLVGQQVAVLEEVVEAAVPEEREFWLRQLAETLAAAAQEGTLSDGIEQLERLAASLPEDDPLKAFLAFRLASARYASRMLPPEADVEEVQAAWLAELAEFVEAYPEAEDAAEAMLQISIADEFSGREPEALQRYQAIAQRYPDSPSAAKARGAARRLQSVGQPLDLTGTTVDGKQLSLSQFKGVPVLVHYWATWCEPCKVDMARIRELQERYGRQKLAVVGIALDGDTGALQQFLAARPLPWPQLHESEGLDGRLAEELGVLTLPTMLLLDKDGVVVDRNLMVTDLEKRLDEQINR